ncbi:GNAT family N-acetyltransferase [Rudaeicoccus suwonensis]|uniref:RimJ/RimL family protein N-acetyltransferase n=1 Tax=Rudaeicoccus suwonensis TaxID=657409 RepID=A0A561E928_9MICO|nr:GNAT family protein [Rudaeicoccus suwonensis]TWE12122.1 RimJ/RimL family protein N-acetyltransferase [Rudaeicoccus suwonensis]
MRRYADASPDLLRQLPALDELEEQFLGTVNGAGGHWKFAVCLRDIPAGNVAVRMRGMRVGWCSYWVAAECRGRGLASTALSSLAAFAFEELDAFRLKLAHRLDNPASGAVARAAGFAPEGIMRAELEYDGVRYDTRMWSRLRTDPAPAAAFPRIPSEGHDVARHTSRNG